MGTVSLSQAHHNPSGGRSRAHCRFAIYEVGYCTSLTSSKMNDGIRNAAIGQHTKLGQTQLVDVTLGCENGGVTPEEVITDL